MEKAVEIKQEIVDGNGKIRAEILESDNLNGGDAHGVKRHCVEEPPVEKRRRTNKDRVENLDRRVGRSEERPPVEKRQRTDEEEINYLAKSIAVKIRYFFQFLNTAKSKDKEIDRLNGVLLASNKYAISEKEADEDAIWDEFVTARKMAAEMHKCKTLIALHHAFFTLKDSTHAQDVKKNILYIRSKIDKRNSDVEMEYSSEIDAWYTLYLTKKLKNYLKKHPNPRSYVNPGGHLGSIPFIHSRITYYKENATTENNCRIMEVSLRYNLLCRHGRRSVLENAFKYLQSQDENDLEDIEQHYLSVVFGQYLEKEVGKAIEPEIVVENKKISTETLESENLNGGEAHGVKRGWEERAPVEERRRTNTDEAMGENANGNDVENLDNRIGRGVPTVERPELANKVNFLTKSMEVKIHFLFQFLNTAESKDSEIERLNGVLVPSNQYAISEEEANDEAIWVDFADERKTTAESNKCKTRIAPLYSAFVALKDSIHAHDVKKNILYIKSKIAERNGAIETEFCEDIDRWFDTFLQRKLEQYLSMNPNPRSYRRPGGPMGSIPFVNSRIEYYKKKASTDGNNQSMETFLMYNHLSKQYKWAILVDTFNYLENEDQEDLEDFEQDFISVVFGFTDLV